MEKRKKERRRSCTETTRSGRETGTTPNTDQDARPTDGPLGLGS